LFSRLIRISISNSSSNHPGSTVSENQPEIVGIVDWRRDAASFDTGLFRRFSLKHFKKFLLQNKVLRQFTQNSPYRVEMILSIFILSKRGSHKIKRWSCFEVALSDYSSLIKDSATYTIPDHRICLLLPLALLQDTRNFTNLLKPNLLKLNLLN